MGISNITRMKEALVDDEVNYLRTLSQEDLLQQCIGFVIEKYDTMAERHIIEEYEMLE